MRILVPVDDMLFAEIILQFLKDQNWPENSQIRVVHVLTPLQLNFRWPNESLEKTANEFIDTVINRYQALMPNATVLGTVLRGPVTERLDELVAEWPADMIVMGSHSRSGIGRTFIGSVSSHMAQYAACPVVVLRPALANHPTSQAEPIWLEDMTKEHREYLEQHAGEKHFPLDGSDWSRLVAMRMQHEAETSGHPYQQDLMEQLHSLQSPLAHERAQLHDSHVHWFTIRGGSKRPRTMESEDSGKHALRVLTQIASNKTLKEFERDWLEKRFKAWGSKVMASSSQEVPAIVDKSSEGAKTDANGQSEAAAKKENETVAAGDASN